MATSRRRDIINYLVNRLKTIEGQNTGFNVITSELDEDLLTELEEVLVTETGEGAYTLHTRLYNNVFKGIRYLDQISDFPAIYLQAGQEVYDYNSKTNTEGLLQIMLRIYTYNEDSISTLEEMVEDVAYVLERIQYSQEHRIISSEIISIDTDSGLLEPYGLGEIKILVRYDVED